MATVLSNFVSGINFLYTLSSKSPSKKLDIRQIVVSFEYF